MSTVDEVRSLIEGRLGELDREQEKLHRALRGLAGGNGAKRGGSPRDGRSEARRASVRSGKGRRSRKGGTRSQQALDVIEKAPGSTATQVADELKIQVSYVYKILGDLAKGGKLRKEGTAYWASK